MAFANILLSGPCNLRCPDCIGRQLPARPSNLSLFPLRGLARFCLLLAREGVTQVTLTGTNTDPQLHWHEADLIEYLRAHVPGARLNLHTNGVLALARMETFNRYDRACISLPSFEPETCRRMTGSARVLPLARILHAARIPVKISTLVSEHNVAEIPSIIDRCRSLGIRRMALTVRCHSSRAIRSTMSGASRSRCGTSAGRRSTA
jgi:MoaA/NifB/PqqE/SkfB family radical SAM enzyme